MGNQDEKNNGWAFPDINPRHDALIDENEAPDVAVLMQELATLRKDYQALYNEYEQNKQISMAIFERLTQSSKYIEDELIDEIRNIINSICNKLIQRELLQDQQLLVDIIEHLKKSLDNNNGPISIYVCEKDYNTLKSVAHPLSDVVKVDKLLNVGDVILQSNVSEIRAVINENINNLLGSS